MLAEPNRPVEGGDGGDLPEEGDETERQQVQRVEDDGREGRVGERQREVRSLVGVDVAVEGAGVVEGGGAAQVDVQVDEVGAVGRQVCPGESRGDAGNQQQRRRRSQPSGGGGVGVYPPDSNDRGPVRSPPPLVSVTIA